jgi:tetratricopeptide (TPR) repeat protein
LQQSIRTTATPTPGCPGSERALKARATDAEYILGLLYPFITLGQLDAAVAIGEFVVAHDPLCTVCQYHLARAYRLAGKFDEAEAAIRSALILTGAGQFPMYRDLGRVLMFKGNPEAALEAFEKDQDLQGIAIALHDLGRREDFEAALARLHEDEDEHPSLLATVYAWIGDVDKAFEYLDKEYSIDRASLSRIMRYPVFRSLYDDPRWQALLHKLGMSDEQLAAIDFQLPPALLKTLENR